MLSHRNLSLFVIGTKRMASHSPMGGSGVLSPGSRFVAAREVLEDHDEERPSLLSRSNQSSSFVPSPAVAFDETTMTTSTKVRMPKSTVHGRQLDSIEKAHRDVFTQKKLVLEKLPSSMADDDDEEIGIAASTKNKNWRDAEAQREVKRNVLRQFPRFGYHVFGSARRSVSFTDDTDTFKDDKLNPVRRTKNNGRNFVKEFNSEEHVEMATSDLSASENPHFPTTTAEDDENGPSVTSNAASEVHNENKQEAMVEYDAYVTRAHNMQPTPTRDLSFWEDSATRDIVETRREYFADAYASSLRDEGPMDTADADHHAKKIQKETLLFLQAYPINEMIQDARVKIQRIEPSDGSSNIRIPASEQRVVSLSEGLQFAKVHQLDLVRCGAIQGKEETIGLCVVADSRRLIRETVRFKLAVQGGVQPFRLRECIEVPFRGGTHPFAIRVKAYGIAKHLIRSTPIRVNLTDFGTPREGFPVFQTILDEIKKQCALLKAFHACGPVQSNYNEIFCFLHPSTAKNPRVSITHPTVDELSASMREQIDRNDKEIMFDDYYNIKHPKERLAYQLKLEQGTAWAEKDEGLSLKRQRDIKLMLGYIPKGNKELYSGRGDVDVRYPFRTSHPTSAEKFSYPPETNLEQAARGAAVLGKRYDMDVSDMHDRNETPDQPSSLERFYYKISGPALQVGEVKESFGFKRNRKTIPGMMPGTLGDGNRPQEDPLRAAK